jgi:hypothetical protein
MREKNLYERHIEIVLKPIFSFLQEVTFFHKKIGSILDFGMLLDEAFSGQSAQPESIEKNILW